MVTSKKLNDQAWEAIFRKYNILKKIEQNGVFLIKSSVINKFRESRLMTKFDHVEDLPKIFKDNNLSILPTSRWTYAIGDFCAHMNLDYDSKKIVNVQPRTDLESLDCNNLFSEAVALNYALLTGMLTNVLDETCEQTINGRMSSQRFSFNIKNINNTYRLIEVDKAQIEIDWWYEGNSKLALIEAKMGKCDDFIVRQLYYPYRLRSGKIQKEIVPILMTVSNDVFSFFIFKFNEENDYSSISLVEQKNFIIWFESISLDEIVEISNTVSMVESPQIPFPQADDFEKCVNMLEILFLWEKTKKEIAEEYSFTMRQADYYTNATKYLGLVEKSSCNARAVSLTPLARDIMGKSRRDRILSLIKVILSHWAFNKSFKKYLDLGERPTREDIVQIMKEQHIYRIRSDTTYKRRSSTVMGWIERIIATTEERE